MVVKYFKCTLLSDVVLNAQTASEGELRCLDMRNMTDIMAVSRILEKIGSRTIISKGKIDLPRDVVDQVNFLAGKENVPLEYHPLLNEILKNQKGKDPAFLRENARFEEFKKLNELPLDALEKEADKIQKFYRKVNLHEAHPERIKMAVETLLEDSIMRVEKIKENIYLDQHLLGGTIERKVQEEDEFQEEEEEEEDYGYGFEEEYSEGPRRDVILGGQLIRSKRVPTLLEMVIYGTPINLDFQSEVSLDPAQEECFAFLINPRISDQVYKHYEFSDFMQAFSTLIDPDLLPQFLK